MRLSLLGTDTDSLQLVAWAIGHFGQVLTTAYASQRHLAEITSLAPRVRLSQNWEELLAGKPPDAVIVARSAPEFAGSFHTTADIHAERLKRLVQAKVPLLVVTPACEAIVGFEIEMLRRDLGGVIVPYTPGLLHPAIDQLAALVTAGDAGPIGLVEQVSFERELADRSRDAILLQLARDIGIIRKLVGPVQTVTASEPTRPIGRDPLGPKPKDLPTLQNLSVTFTSEEGLTARWTVAPCAIGPQGRLALAGQRGKAILTMPAQGDWSLDMAGDQFSTESFAANADVERVFWQLSHSAPPQPLYDDTAWLDACRDQEAAEAVDRSLLKGRTIELFREEHTETASFKSIMAMGGCLLLVLAICVLLVVSLVEGLQLPLRNLAAWRLWPVYLLAPIGAFLLLQFLGLALGAPKPETASRHKAAKASEGK